MRRVITLLSILLTAALPAAAQDFGSVRGMVLTADSYPVDGVFVTLSSEGGHGGGHGGGNHMLRTETDEEGRFSFERVEAGDYEISAMAYGLGIDCSEM